MRGRWTGRFTSTTIRAREGAPPWTSWFGCGAWASERYEAAFRENEIDETVLPNLTLEDLKELGVGRSRAPPELLDAIAALRSDTGGNAPSADVATASSVRTALPKTAPNAAKLR